MPAANIAIEWLNVQGLRGKGAAALLLAPFRLIRACWQALRILRRTRPKAVLGMGGFASGPGGLVAWMLDGFQIDGFGSALLGAILVSLTGWFANSFVGANGRFELVVKRG